MVASDTVPWVTLVAACFDLARREVAGVGCPAFVSDTVGLASCVPAVNIQLNQDCPYLTTRIMAMILVVKYGQSWFNWMLTAGTQEASPTVSDTKAGQPTPATSRRARSKQAATSVTQGTVSDATIERRAVLAPLSVEVVYAGGHRTFRTRDSSLSLNMPPNSPAVPEADAAPKVDTAPKAD